MSRVGTNVEVVRSVFERFSEGRIDLIHELLTEDFEWTFYGPEELPWAGTYIGGEGVDRFFEIVGGLIEVEEFEAREFIDAGETVVVLGTSTARVLATGARYTTNWSNTFTLRDGRICRLLDLYETGTVLLTLLPERTASR